MARMSDLQIDIEERLRDGYSVESVALILGVPYEWVKQVAYAIDYLPENDAFETCNFVEE